MDFDITILGSAGSHTGPGRACSGYLFRAGDTRVMVDCGNGSTMNLQRLVPFWDLDAVLITHRHADHCVDLVGMFYALKFHREGLQQVPLYAAPEVEDMLTALLSQDSAMEFRETFPSQPVRPGSTFEVGPMRFELFPSIHPVPTVSVRVSCEDRVAVYSSDTWGGPDLVDAAHGADLFLCEATWQGEMEDWPEGIHLTAKAAGEIATRAEVERLVLTHLWPENDPDRSLEEARQTWSGPVALAEDLQVWAPA